MNHLRIKSVLNKKTTIVACYFGYANASPRSVRSRSSNELPTFKKRKKRKKREDS